MDYKKPEIVDCSEAVTMIQGSKNGLVTDSFSIYRPMQTAAAYEADE
jgi:hypothetical protein